MVHYIKGLAEIKKILYQLLGHYHMPELHNHRYIVVDQKLNDPNGNQTGMGKAGDYYPSKLLVETIILSKVLQQTEVKLIGL